MKTYIGIDLHKVNPEDFKFIETVKSDFFEKVKTLKQVWLKL